MNANEFIDNYKNYYKDIEEIDPPSAPLPDDLNLQTIFAEEADIFGIFFPEETPNNKCLILLKDTITLSDSLKMEKLTSKLAAIWAYYLRHQYLNK